MGYRKAYLLMGSNIGDRHSALERAMELMKEREIYSVTTSPIYETAAWGSHPQPAFLNQAVEVNTLLDPERLMTSLLEIESVMGRFRTQKMEPRIIDLDILFYESAIFSSDIVILPHPLIQERRFVLKPLSDICPDFIHPVIKKSIRELLEECKDPLKVEGWTTVSSNQ